MIGIDVDYNGNNIKMDDVLLSAAVGKSQNRGEDSKPLVACFEKRL